MARYVVNSELNKLMVYPQREDDYAVLMRLPSRRWMKKAKMFVVPATRTNCAHLLASSLVHEIGQDPEALAFIQDRAVTKTGERQFPRWYAHKNNPFPDQQNAIIKGYKNDMFAFYMRMGSGKSKSAIDIVTAHFYERKILAGVVICPNAVKPVWLGNEIDKHSPCPTLKVDVDSDFEAHLVPVHQQRLTWLVVGVESLSQGRTFERLLPFITTHPCAVVVDESTTIANHKTIRTQRVIQLGKHAQVRGVMTGTPISKMIIDLFSQFEFLGPDIVGCGDYYAFRNRYCVMGGFKNKKIVAYDNIEELMTLIEPYVYICDKPKGLPQKLFTTREVTLAPEQKEMYRKLRRAEIQEVSIANVLNKMGKLQEITEGYLREDPVRSIDPLTGREKKTQGRIIWELPMAQNPKIIELHNVIEEWGDNQMVVWCKSRWALAQIAKALEVHGTVGQLHGDIPTDESDQGRTAIVRGFQEGKYRFIAATQQVGGIGHTMTAAHLMVYYSNTHSMVNRLQSEDRIHRIGQDQDCLYMDLIAQRTVDVPIIESVKEKKDLEEYVRDRMKQASATFNDLLGGEG